MSIYKINLVADGTGDRTSEYFESNLDSKEIVKVFREVDREFNSNGHDLTAAVETINKTLSDTKKLVKTDVTSYNIYW